MSIPRNLSKLAEGANSSGVLGVTFGGTNANNAADARTNLGLGSAATQASTAFATAAQGTLADNAVSALTSNDGSVVISTTGTSKDLSVGVAGSTATLISQVRNETGATLTKGTVVYISGASSNKALVTKALATSDATSAQTYGVVQADISNNNNGYVVVIGVVSNLDTSAYANGAQLYLSGVTAGTYTNIKPYAPIHLVYVGIVTRSHATQGTIEVKIQNGYEMDELHNVSAQSPTTGQTLVYNSSNSLWEKNTVSLTAGVNGVLPTANGGTNLSSFTSGGLVYASNSSTLATGSGLTFDTQTFSVLTSNATPFQVSSSNASATVVLQTNSNASVDLFYRFRQNAGAGNFYDLTMEGSTNAFTIDYNDGERLRITSVGNVGIGASLPVGYTNYKGLTIADSAGAFVHLRNTANTHQAELGVNGGNSTFYIATYTSTPIQFLTNGSLKATLNSAGQFVFPAASTAVGISWDNYGHIFGEYSSGATYLSSNYYPTPGSAGYKTSVTGTYGAAGISVNGTGGSSNDGIIAFYASPATAKTASVTFSPTERMRIVGDTGNVGINSNNPQNIFHVVGQTRLSYTSINDHALNAGTALEIRGPAMTADSAIKDYFKGFKIALNDGTEWGSQAQFSVGRWEESSAEARSSLVISLGHGSINSASNADVNVMTLLSSGNVGIGQTNPGYPLEIASTNPNSFAWQRTGVSAKKWAFTSDNSFTYLYNTTDNVLAVAFQNNGNVNILNGSLAVGYSGIPAANLDLRGSGVVSQYIISSSAGPQQNQIVSLYNSGAAYGPLNIDGSVLQFKTSGSTKATVSSTGLDVTGVITVNQNSAGVAGAFANSDATNGYGVYIHAGGSAVTRYGLVVRDPAGNQDWFKISSETGQVGHSIFAPGAYPSSEIARFTTTGLGIGTNAPRVKLGVLGTATGVIELVNLHNQGASNGDGTSLTFSGYNSPSQYPTWRYAGIKGVYDTTSPGVGNAGWGGKLSFFVNRGVTADGFEDVITLTAGGNVGIGRDNPFYKLDIFDAATGVTTMRLLNSFGLYTSNAYGYSRFQGLSGGNGLFLSQNVNGINGGSSVLDSSSHSGYAISMGENYSGWAFLKYAAGAGTVTPSVSMILTSAGNLLVGTTSTEARFCIRTASADSSTYAAVWRNSADTGLLYMNSNGALELPQIYANFTTGNAANMFIASSGGQVLRSTSSIKYKKNVQDATHGLAEVLQLRPVTYEGKSETDVGKTFGGLIAEEVHAIGLTEFVQYAEDGSPDALAYGNMISLLTKAMQEQQAIIESLKARLDAANL